MFNNIQRNLFQRSTVTTDNRPTTTIGVKVGVKDTYITNKTSDYASKVFEPKGSKFITVADVDFTPTEPGIYTLPSSHEDLKNIVTRLPVGSTSTNLEKYDLKPSSFKTTMILPPQNWSLKGYSLAGASGYGSSINVLKKAFDESFSKDGRVVLTVQRGNVTQDLVMTYSGQFVPFQGQTAAASLNNDGLPSGLFPENINEIVNTFPNCCDDLLEGWNSNPFPEPLPNDPPERSQPWSPTNPCGWLGSVILCDFRAYVEMNYEDSPLDPPTTSEDSGHVWGERGYNPSGLNGEYPPNFQSACGFVASVGTGTSFLQGRYCYTVTETGFDEIWRDRIICVEYDVYCNYITIDYYSSDCGCPGCSCKRPQCIEHPNCVSYRRDNPLTVSPNPEPIMLPDEI